MKNIYTLLKNDKYLFWCSIVILLVVKICYILFIGIPFSDSDQTMQWYAAKEYANGNFNSIYFYGQNYNPMIEALAASPFVSIGIQPYIILPIISTFFGLMPWLVLILVLRRHAQPWLAALFILILAALPYEFQLIHMIPRGWVQGLFIASIGIFILFQTPSKLTITNIFKISLSGLLGGIGTYCCPNAILYFIPLSVFWWFQSDSKKSYILGGNLALLFIIGYILTQKVLINFPFHNYIIHWNAPMEFSTVYLLQNVEDIFLLFIGFVLPFAKTGILVFFIFIYIIYKSKKVKNHTILYTSIATIVLLVITFFIRKSNNGESIPYFPFARFYMGIVPIMYMLLIFIQKEWLDRNRTTVLIACIGITITQILLLSYTHQKYENIDGFVRVLKTKKLCEVCDSINRVMDASKETEALIYNKCDEIEFGCPALGYNKHLLYPLYDRNKDNHEIFLKSDTTNMLHIGFENSIYKIYKK